MNLAKMAFLKRKFVLLVVVVIIVVTTLALSLGYNGILDSYGIYSGSNNPTNVFSKGVIRTSQHKQPKDADATYHGKSKIRHKQEHTTPNDEPKFEPYCSMYSNAHKKLLWSDEPNVWTDWTYTRRRKCSKIAFPNNRKIANRTKLSLHCDKNGVKLVPSLTISPKDFQIINLNSSCLSTFINKCCNDDRGIPNIVHYVWYFKKQMPLYMFTSILSVIRFLRPCLILFHGEFLPYGKYWDYIINIYPNILHVKRPRPLDIFGVKIKSHAHSGDMMRLEALIQLGGIYMDTDFIILRDLEPLRQYNMTLCYQATKYLHNAFIMAKKDATFLHLWMEGYRKDFRNTSYTYNSMTYNKNLAYKKPNLIHIEDGTLCCPAFLIGKSANPNILYNWSGLYGYHIVARDKALRDVPWDINWLRNFNTTLGSMLRYVVYGNKEMCA